VERHGLERLQGESDRDYLQRLKTMDRTDWSVDDRMAHALFLRKAERAVAGRLRSPDARGGDEPLQQIKRLVGRLSPGQRRQLSQWIARGSPTEGLGVPENREGGRAG
jgi:hypothetical protein